MEISTVASRGQGASLHETSLFLTDAQLHAELRKCEFCHEKPCLEACPCHCSPADFIKAVEQGERWDYRRAAAQIMGKNPLGGVCGLVCPDYHCMAACVHLKLDGAVDIPRVQAAIVERAKQQGEMPAFERPVQNGKQVAVVGGGPAGLAAAALLAQHGTEVTIIERDDELGGMCRCIPDSRLDKDVLRSDIRWLLSLGTIHVKTGTAVSDPRTLLGAFDAVVMATGLWSPIRLGIPGEEHALAGLELLRDPEAHRLSGKVAVVGGGATAYDCAMTALEAGASQVELVALESLAEMPLTRKEMAGLVRSGVDVSGRTRLKAIVAEGGRIREVRTEKVELMPGRTRFALDAIHPVPDSLQIRKDLSAVIVAIGLRPDSPKVDDPRIVYAGDVVQGPTTVVEAAAAGKNAADAVLALLQGESGQTWPRGKNGRVKSTLLVPGYNKRPVSLETSFFGRTLTSPFLLSAAPPTDGLDQMRAAYRAGWAGGIMKTAFDGVPIHIPAEYMFSFDRKTYANCDNVSGHALDRVCREVETLVREFPDRLTAASTGGPVTGRDEDDRQGWVSNTRKLEAAGAMAIEYSLSCPQGGDGTEGDIVSQNAALTARIVEWIIQAGDSRVPKLFKLTGAVTSVAVIVQAVKEVLLRYPDKPAGITLANSFPTLAFRPKASPGWDEGVIVGASGAGILNISYLSLAKVAHLNVHISGNGGPMDYRAAAHFLALGVRTVQFCTLVMKYGYDIVEDLCQGVSHLMAARGLRSMEALIGAALPKPVTDFMDLPARKRVSHADPALCLRCGNCGRCPYLAISSDEQGYPKTDPARCVGCSICALKCFAQAITMRERTAEELAVLKEH